MHSPTPSSSTAPPSTAPPSTAPPGTTPESASPHGPHPEPPVGDDPGAGGGDCARRLRIAAELHAATLTAVIQTGIDPVRQITEIYWERVEGRHFLDEAALNFIADHLATVRAHAREDADALAGSVMGLQLQALGRGLTGSPSTDAGAPDDQGGGASGGGASGGHSRGGHE